jgi:hypothetical protein
MARLTSERLAAVPGRYESTRRAKLSSCDQRRGVRVERRHEQFELISGTP